ncbi:MAG: EI24 domain-containing protein [Deltaproteobacteria bacterium]|nr:EI24 domain-containing protein [Deltaproteobacteria bacterium]
MVSLGQGIADFVRGARYVAARPRLYKWVALPFLISLVILAVVAWLAWSLAAPGAEAVADLLPGFLASLVGGALKVLLVLVIGVGGYVLFFAIAALITTPFCELLSEAVEVEVSGGEAPAGNLARDLVMGIGHAIRRVLLYLLAVLAIFLLGLVIPVIGPIVAALVTIMLTIRFAAFDAMDTVMARHGWSYDQKKSFLQQHRSRTFGLGAGVAGLAVIPIVGALALPLGAAGATLLYLEVGSSSR